MEYKKFTICGKGGSGKSTVTALMAKQLAASGRRVLVLDCDESNYGLHQQLGMELPKSFTDYFGGKTAVMGMLSGGPKNMPVLFDHPWTIDDIPEEYRTEKDGIYLMTPGKIETANEACACPFNAVMAQFIPMLDLGENDVVIMDMEAGIEHFGRGTDNATDCVLMVVDPSYESIKLSQKIGEICEGIQKPIYYVLNKVTPENREAMRAGVKNADQICCELGMDAQIMNAGLMGNELTQPNGSISKMLTFFKA